MLTALKDLVLKLFYVSLLTLAIIEGMLVRVGYGSLYYSAVVNSENPYQLKKTSLPKPLIKMK